MSSNVFPSTGTKPKFDPNKKFEVVEDTPAPKKPKFDPNKSFEEVSAIDQTPAIPKMDFSKPLWKELPKGEMPAQAPIATATTDYTANPWQAEAASMTITYPNQRKLADNVGKAQQKIFNELTTNDDVLERTIRQERYDIEARARLDAQAAGARSDMPSVQNPQLAFDQRLPQQVRPEDIPVTPEDIEKEKIVITQNPAKARNLLESVAKYKPEKANEIQASIYQLDIAGALQDDPNAQARLNKVLNNAHKLEKGELVYDWRMGRLFKPENVVQSAITGWKNKTKSFEDYDFFKRTQNNAAIAMQLDADRTDVDPDEPLPVPAGKLSELSGMAGGTPVKALIGGAVGSLAGPEAGIAAGSIIGGRETAKLEYANTFRRVYYELRDNDVDPDAAVVEARKQAEQAAEIGAITGGIAGLVGARIGMKPLPKAAITEGFRKSVISGLKGMGTTLSPAIKEGLAVGGVAGAGEVYKNALAQEAGINRPIDEGVAEQIENNLLFTTAMAAAVKGSKAFSAKSYRSLLNGLSKVDEGYVDKTLGEWQENGQITPEQATATKEAISAQKTQDATIPPDIAPEARIEIQDKIAKRDELEASMETLHKSFHPAIKEKIKAIDEQIAELSNDKVKVPKEEKEVLSIINDAAEEGRLEGMMGDIAKSDPEGFMKFVADQALGRNEDGSISSIDNADYAVRGQYGDALVDKALEMYPLKTGQIQAGTPEYFKANPKEFVDKINSNLSGVSLKYAGPIEGNKGLPLDIVKNGKTVGYITIKLEEGIVSPSIVRIDKEYQRQGITEDLYVQMNKALNKEGLGPLYSDKTFLDGKAGGEPAKNLWDKLVNKGQAEKIGDRYRFIPEKKSSISVIRPEERVQPTETITIKPQEDALRQQLPAEEISRPIESGGNIPESSTGVRPSEQGEIPPGTRPEIEGEIAGEGQVGEPPMIGITHEQLNQVARELNLPEYEGDPETVAGWDFEAKKRINENPNAIPNLLDKLAEGKQPDKIEQRMMIQYIADLKARIDKNPSDSLLALLKRARNLSDIVGGREVAKSLRARQGSVPVEESLADYMIRQMETSGVSRLTEKQKEINVREYEKFSDAKNSWDAYNAKRIEELATKKAEEMVSKMRSETPKTKKAHGEYVQERKDLIQSIQDKLKKARGESSVTVVPYAKELFAIAPDVAKLVKSLVAEGIDKLPDVIAIVHEQLKDLIKEITPEDVRALVAGEYNEKLRTRSELTAKLKDLKDEAALIGRLQALESGIEPKNERAKVKRNQEIERLKVLIKEHDLTKLAASKTRMKTEIAKIEKQLEDGNFAAEEKLPPPRLDKEGQELKDKLIQLRKEREVRLAEEDYANRSGFKKAMDLISAPFREVRTIKSSFDLSAPLRQGVIPTAAEIITNPGRAGKRFVRMLKSAGSEKYFDRWLYDLKNSPEWHTIEQSGLSIAEPGNITKKEEVFQSRLAEKIPVIGTIGIKGSERAYAFWLNAQRVDLFKKGAERMTEKGMTFENSPDAYKSWAKTVNALTGRGELAGPLKNAAEALSIGFFSPRLIASRLSFFNPKFYKDIPAPLRMMVVKDMIKFIGLGTTVLALGKIGLGADVEADPRSPDFGKMKFGDTRYDIWGGFQQYIRLFSTLATQSKKTSGGQVQSLINKDGSNKSGAVISTFFRSKAAPLLGSIMNVATGEDVVGQPVTLGSEAKRFLLPILWEDVYKASKDEGVKGALATAIPGMVGVGVMTYEAQKSTGSNKKKGHSKPARNKRKNPSTQNN